MQIVVKILGRGCQSCNKLYQNAKAAVEELDPGISVIKVTDVMSILRYQSPKLPAIVINDKLVAYGEILSVQEVKDLLGQIDS